MQEKKKSLNEYMYASIIPNNKNVEQLTCLIMIGWVGKECLSEEWLSKLQYNKF
jgi:hypothetical protein